MFPEVAQWYLVDPGAIVGVNAVESRPVTRLSQAEAEILALVHVSE